MSSSAGMTSDARTVPRNQECGHPGNERSTDQGCRGGGLAAAALRAPWGRRHLIWGDRWGASHLTPLKRGKGRVCDPRKDIPWPPPIADTSQAGHLRITTSSPRPLEGPVPLRPECVASGRKGQASGRTAHKCSSAPSPLLGVVAV